MFKQMFRAALAAIVIPICCFAQQPQTSVAPASNQPFTLQTNVRAVVTDVLVLDRHGNPVRNLPASAFHLFDEKQPQILAFFEEHQSIAPTAEPQQAAKSNEYSNDVLLHPPPALNVLLLDIVNLQVADQMWLADQLVRLIRRLPEGLPCAIYLHGGTRNVLLQDFTADHAKLLTAVQRAMPYFPPLSSADVSDATTLAQMANDLVQVPGRKNLLWFSGGSTLVLNPAGIAVPSANLRSVYDQLETGRIAVFPIDARGLQVLNTGVESPGQRVYESPLPQQYGNPLLAQQGVMQDLAEATGGIAFYNTNGLWQAAKQVMDTDRDFYTLSYSPTGLKNTGKWHNVRVEVDGDGLRLSYRRGYFADNSHEVIPKGPRTRLLTEGKKQTVFPDVQGSPIVFHAEVEPVDSMVAAPAGGSPVPRGQARYAVHLSLPSDAFSRKHEHDESELVVGVALLATARDGTPVAVSARQVTFSVNEDRHPGTPIPLTQYIDLRKGDAYLSVAVWDTPSRRSGAIHIPFHVAAAQGTR